MDLEFHQLDLRYEDLRTRSPARERWLLSSLAGIGQQTPIVVVAKAEPAGPARHVVIDGYKRVRLLRKLGQDTVRATAWELDESEALLLERMMRAGEVDSALEQGWLLCVLRERFRLSGAELGRRFARTESWVSRRLGLVAELPESVQQHVRAGAIGAHAAMKYLLPLARAKRADCERLADAAAKLKPSTRQMALLYAAWSKGNSQTREMILREPVLVVRAHEQMSRAREQPHTLAEQMRSDLDALRGIAGRLEQRMQQGELRGASAPELVEIRHVFSRTSREVARLLERMEKEVEDARQEHA